MNIELATVTTKRQFTIPKTAAQRLHIVPGDIIELHDTAEGLLIKKHPMPKPTVSGRSYPIKRTKDGFVSLTPPPNAAKPTLEELLRLAAECP